MNDKTPSRPHQRQSPCHPRLSAHIGVESRNRIIYRLVNVVYVLGITMADQDSSINILEYIHIVNPSRSVVVVTCKGVDVTTEKLARKYVEVCMALDIALRRVSSIRLSVMISWMHKEGIAEMVHSALDIEAKIISPESSHSPPTQASWLLHCCLLHSRNRRHRPSSLFFELKIRNREETAHASILRAVQGHGGGTSDNLAGWVIKDWFWTFRNEVEGPEGISISSNSHSIPVCLRAYDHPAHGDLQTPSKTKDHSRSACNNFTPCHSTHNGEPLDKHKSWESGSIIHPHHQSYGALRILGMVFVSSDGLAIKVFAQFD
ncbi:hypothetical protein SAY87_016457 [Trapa incisa]|uniref:Uncharacterized protein n=1 Tax=Trapa incisa TaxID=236973 RepID=A0AAN7LGZ4_9MYRT|nr:hypothetical protein SAY87_016457 [Trapa incisa]